MQRQEIPAVQTDAERRIIGKAVSIRLWMLEEFGFIVGIIDATFYRAMGDHHTTDFAEAENIALDNARQHLEAALAEINAEIEARAVAK